VITIEATKNRDDFQSTIMILIVDTMSFVSLASIVITTWESYHTIISTNV